MAEILGRGRRDDAVRVLMGAAEGECERRGDPRWQHCGHAGSDATVRHGDGGSRGGAAAMAEAARAQGGDGGGG